MDYRIEQWVNGPAGHSGGWDTLLHAAAIWALPALFAFVVIWFAFGWIAGKPAERHGAVLALLAAAAGSLLRQLVFLVWQRPRPFAAHPQTVHKLISHVNDPSFPSGHTTAAMAIAVAVLVVHPRIGTLAIAVALIIGYSRVYVGVHYPGDVVAGALVGAAVTLVLWGPLAMIPTTANNAVTSLIRRSPFPPPDHRSDRSRPG
jgi:undecaprenyl-diphosphatase